MAQKDSESNGAVRFAVVGLGHIAQAAVLPAFENAAGCDLRALVSGDQQKMQMLQQHYRVTEGVDYAGYDALLESGSIDAVYIALPNAQHADYAVRALNRGIHVLCEKPLAATAEECEAMIAAAHVRDVRLMVAYRLHFELINLEVAELVASGAVGDPRVFSSVFTQNINSGDIRLAEWEQGGGSVFDMGVYCINAARYLFRDEPISVVAASSFETDSRFRHCDEMTSAVLTFPRGRMAQFCSSMGAHPSGDYRVVGTAGEIVVRNAYDYTKAMSYELCNELGEVRSRHIGRRDQFAPQLEYFSTCIREKREPEPNGWEGYADVRIVSSIHEAARTGRRVELEPIARSQRPGLTQAMFRPAVEAPEEPRD